MTFEITIRNQLIYHAGTFEGGESSRIDAIKSVKVDVLSILSRKLIISKKLEDTKQQLVSLCEEICSTAVSNGQQLAEEEKSARDEMTDLMIKHREGKG